LRSLRKLIQSSCDGKAIPRAASTEENACRIQKRSDFIHRGAAAQGAFWPNRLTASVGTACFCLEAGPNYLHPWLIFRWLRQTFRRSPVQLVLRDRAAICMPRPQRHRAAGKGSRRVQFDQWPHLYPRPGRRTLIFGGSSAMPLELRRRPALLPQGEDNARGADEFHGAGGPLGVSDLRDRHPLRVAYVEAALPMRVSAQRRFQRRGAGRRGLLPDHDAQRRALLDRGWLLKQARRRPNLKVVPGGRSPRAFSSIADARPASSILSAPTNTARAPMAR